MLSVKTLPLLGLLSALAVSCTQTPAGTFLVEGTIRQGEGRMLYLEETGRGEVRLLDSLRLSKEGKFSFSQQGASYPMFYRLRLGDQFVSFAADSLTQLTISSQADSFFRACRIVEADAYNYQIREIDLLRSRADQQIDSISMGYRNGTVALEQARAQIDSISTSLKQELATRYIYVDPKSPAAYFALFQSYAGGSYFSPEQAGDERAFAAVATAYDNFYPRAPYTALLKETALQALALSRQRYRAAHPDSTQAVTTAQVISFPELRLKDAAGKEVSLTELSAQGTVLLSFTSYAADWSPSLVAGLRRLQEQHPEIHIYEVSVDRDDYFWRNAAHRLPWVTVHDPQGTSLGLYNVQGLPSFYAIKGGELTRLAAPDDILR